MPRDANQLQVMVDIKLPTSTVDFQAVQRGLLVFERFFCEVFFVGFVCFHFVVVLLEEGGVFVLHREV